MTYHRHHRHFHHWFGLFWLGHWLAGMGAHKLVLGLGLVSVPVLLTAGFFDPLWGFYLGTPTLLAVVVRWASRW